MRTQGLAVGSMRGRLVTGTIRAGRVPVLARLPSIEWIELANEIRVTRNE